MAFIPVPNPMSDADALALGRLIEPSLSAAHVTVDLWGADLELPSVRLSQDGHVQVLSWIRKESKVVRTDG